MRLAALALLFLAELPLALANDLWRSVAYGACEEGRGACAPKLKVDESLLRQAGGSRTFVVDHVCVYEAAGNRWSKVAPSTRTPMTVRSAKRAADSRSTDPTLVDLPSRPGLYWLSWREEGHVAHTSVFAGPVLCNDVRLGPAPEGMIAMCVPTATSGNARFVPDPATHCPA